MDLRGRDREKPDRRGRSARRVAALVALVLLTAGCGPTIEAWRSLRGYDIHDPNPKTAPFTGNIDKAYDAPYPNLASVPPPPVLGTDAAERQQLTEKLVAERNTTAALAPPLPASGPGAAPPARATVPSRQAGPIGAAKSPAATPAAAPLPKATASAPEQPKAIASAAAPEQPRPIATADVPNTAPSHRPAPPAAAPPLNTSLKSPTIPAPLPEPQAPQPAPSAPVLTPAPVIQAAPMAPPPSEVATAMPAPPPPPPALPALAPLPLPAPAPGKRPRGVTVATLDAAAAASPGAAAAQIAQVARLYREKPGHVRVVAFAAAPSAGGDPLKLYDAALDRAHAVAGALAAAGIPAGRIATEANPATGRQSGRVEIQLGP